MPVGLKTSDKFFFVLPFTKATDTCENHALDHVCDRYRYLHEERLPAGPGLHPGRCFVQTRAVLGGHFVFGVVAQAAGKTSQQKQKSKRKPQKIGCRDANGSLFVYSHHLKNGSW